MTIEFSIHEDHILINNNTTYGHINKLDEESMGVIAYPRINIQFL